MKKTLEERFWEKVDKRGPDKCWPWAGYRDKQGYGQFWVAGRLARAHRVAYELVNGPIPSGLDALHDCDFPPCCNPTHLFSGTSADNSKDMVKKGRAARGERNGTHTHPERVVRGERCAVRGERNGSAKLTEAKVREIRQLLAEGHPQSEISRRMGVTQPTIGRIVRGEGWCHGRG